jgi:hypothetical protein
MSQEMDSMDCRQFILAWVVFLAGCQPWSGQIAPAAQPVAVPYGASAAAPPPLAAGPPYIEPSPMLIQPAPPMIPAIPVEPAMMPAQSPGMMPPPVVPQPSPLAPAPAPGTMPLTAFGPGAMPQPPAAPGLANPIAVPVVDDAIAWDQIVDVVTDYFTVAREHQARRGGEVWTEGRIETAYQTGATWLEPHRGDSVGSFNRWESTFQTIRRRAVVRVIPDAAGYLVEVIVEKELEDLPNPEKATAGAVIFRTDGSLPSRRLEEVSRTRSSPRWLQLGRDPPLEQRILADIHARLNGIANSASIFSR